MAASTPPGPDREEIMLEKLEAMLAHLAGEHTFPENKFYKECTHGEVHNACIDPGETDRNIAI